MTDNIYPLAWVRAERYCHLSGEPMDTVKSRIHEGIWASGKHYKRTGPRTLWVNTIEADKWVQSQNHVEAATCLPALKSANSSTARASA